MEFKSQIATTREQSYKLLTLGLKPETADMVYHFTNSRVEAMQWELQTKPPTLRGGFWTPERIAKLARPAIFGNPAMSGEELFDELWGKDVPAWSLSRLLEMMPKSIAQVNRPKADLDINSDGQCRFVTYVEFGYDVKHQEMKRDLFDSVISMISWLIANGHFYIEYLKGDIK